jgi:hypothetical protein
MQRFERRDLLSRVMKGKSYINGPRDRQAAVSGWMNRQYDRSIASRPAVIRTESGWSQ